MARRQPVDDDDRERTAAELKGFKPAQDVLPPALYEALTKRKPGQRGPGRKPAKVMVSLRLDPAVFHAYEARGPGWRKAMTVALEKFVDKSSAKRKSRA